MSLATMLKAVVPDSGITATSNNPAQCRELVEAARNHLRNAMLNRDAAVQTVTEATAAAERVMQVIRDADDASLDAQVAVENSENFTKAWSSLGARADMPHTDPKLQAKADTASTRAITAKIAATGAEAGLPAARAALHDAQNAHHVAVERIGAAANAVLVAVQEEQYAIAAKAAADFNEAAHTIQSCCRATGGHYYSFSDDSAAAGMLSRLRSLMPQMPARDVRELKRSNATLEESKKFVEMGHKLLKDPDAK